jgi:hypothetical protein
MGLGPGTLRWGSRYVPMSNGATGAGSLLGPFRSMYRYVRNNNLFDLLPRTSCTFTRHLWGDKIDDE